MGSLLQDVLGLFSKKKFTQPVPYVPSKDDYFVLSTKAESSLNVMAYLPKVEQTLISAKQFADAIVAGTDTTYDYSSAQDGNNVDLILTGSDATIDIVKLLPGTNITLADDGSNNITISSTDQFVGTVTSVDAATNGNAITVSGGPITTAGVLTFNYLGNATQYVNGAGDLETFPILFDGWKISDGFITGTVESDETVVFEGGAKIATGLLIAGGNPEKITITHLDTTRVDTSSVVTPAFGGSFTVVDTIIQDATGHPTAVNLKTVTLPTPAAASNTTYVLGGAVSNVDDYSVSLTGSDGSLTKTLLEAGSNITLTDLGTPGVRIDAVVPAFPTHVTSVNSLSGALNLVQGANITIFDDGVNNITISASGGSGSVTSVGLSAPSAFTVSGSPVTGAGTLTFTGSGTASQYIDGTGSLQTFPSVGTGTVTSVGLAMDGNAVSVNGTPVTSSGVLDISWIGLASEYVNGEGNLVAFPVIPSSVPVMSSTVTGTGKLWDDTVQSVGAQPVSTTIDRTYGIQFNSDQQLVVNVPWSTSGGTMSSWTVGDGTGIEPVTDGVEVEFRGLDKISTNVALTGGGVQLNIDHDDTTRTDTTSTASPIAGGTFTVVDSITQDATGHVDAVNVKTITLPSAAAVSTMTSTVLGIGKLFSDVVQAQVALPVSNQDKRTYGVQFNSSNQLVVNVPWINYGNWLLSGDLGPSQEISSNNTVLIAGGIGLATTASATDTLTIDLENTGVTAGAYTNANITVNDQGQILTATNGTGGSASVVGTNGITANTAGGVATVEVDYLGLDNIVLTATTGSGNEPTPGEDHILYNDAKTNTVQKVLIDQLFDAGPIAKTMFSVLDTGTTNGVVKQIAGNWNGLQVTPNTLSNGVYAVSWATPFPTTNYIVQLTTEGSPGNDAVYITEKTVNGFTLQSTNTAGAKINILINVAIFN